MNTGESRKGGGLHYWFVWFTLFSGALLACLIALLWSGLENTLENNGRWTVTKRAMGADSYYSGTQALAGNRLHLGAWHGYQEVLFKEMLSLRELEFDFFLEPNAYVTAFVSVAEGGFHGFRLSSNPDYPCMTVIGRPEGEFRKKTPSSISTLRAGEWHHARIERKNKGMVLSVNGTSVAEESFPDLTGFPGFRGSAKDVMVDNVVLVSRNDRETTWEGFANKKAFVTILPLMLAVIFSVSSGLLYILWRKWHCLSRSCAALLSLHACLVASSAILLGYVHFFHASAYPRVNPKLLRTEDAWREQEREKQYDFLKKTYMPEPGEGVRRILFVGTSQTRGEGARNRQEGLVPRVENYLNEHFKGFPVVECMNLAIRSDRAAAQLHHYRDTWVNYKPSLTVINLGSNDSQTPADDFQKALEGFVRLNQEKGVATLFVLEAVADVGADLLPTHRTMLEVARQFSIPVVNAHACLYAHRDAGFIWWDFVHPTSYGHLLIADMLSREIAGLIQR